MEPYLIDKPLGATPLEALDMLRTLQPALQGVKLSYAGRLDPMATGLIVALHGEQLMRQEEYWHLPKEYDASILLGISTDSYDLLGLAAPGDPSRVHLDGILLAIQHVVGKVVLPVPVFSSGPAAGTSRQMVIRQIDVTSVDRISTDEILATLVERIPLVHGDFRQQEILEQWKNILAEYPSVRWPVVRCTIRCSSGTYIRSLAHTIGARLGSGGLLMDLRRTRVGSWHVDGSSVVRSVVHL